MHSLDGIKTWIAIHTYPVVDNEGEVSHVIEYTQDITERKRAEEALRVSEERYALAARGANDGLWDWDLRTNMIHYSFRWKSMLGYDEKNISGYPEEWFRRVHPDDRGEVEAKIAAHLSGRSEHFESEYRIMHRDGMYRWVLNRGLAIRDQMAMRIGWPAPRRTSPRKKQWTNSSSIMLFTTRLTGSAEPGPLHGPASAHHHRVEATR